MKIGASVWPFKWDPPYDAVIPRIAKLGYKAIELIAWDESDLEYYSPQMIKELRSMMDSEGLELSEFVSKSRGMASLDEDEKQRAIDHFKKQVEVGKELGTSIVNTVSDWPFSLDFPIMSILPQLQKFQVDIPSGLNWDRNWDEYVKVVRRCARICEDAGMRYALEPHPYCLVSNTASMLRLLDHVDSQALGMNYDVSHLFPVGDIPHVSVYQMGKHILHTHFSDNDGLTNVHWRPGRGKIDWEAVMRALKDVGYDGVISIEIEDAPGVSRGRLFGHGVYKGHEVATEAFDRENILTLKYFEDICDRLDIPIV
jgi:sugar phosphate isomerase/epimerase